MSDRHDNAKKPADALGGLLRLSLKNAGGAAGACPPADMLAAYFERSLSGTEVSAAEAHFSNCERCQEQLAAMARIETVMGAGASPDPAAVRGFSFWNWRWMMPTAAAVVGAFAIWVVLRPEMATQTISTSERAAVREQAKPQTPQPAAADAKAAAPAPKEPAIPPRPDAKRLNDEARVSARPPAAITEGLMAKQAAPKSDAQPIVSAPPAEHAFATRAESEKKKEAARTEKDAEERLAAPGASAAETRAAQAQQKNEVTDALRSRDVPKQNQQLAQAPPPAAADPLRSASRVTVDSAKVQTLGAAEAKLHKERQEAPPRQGEAGFSPQRTRDPRPKFSAAHGRVEWRFFESGSVQRYDERLKSGDAKEIPGGKELLAASSPSEKICWAVGRNGLILRTVDTETWLRIGSPVDEDVTGVEARSADDATIRTQSGKTYVTTDGGKTWRTP